LAAINRELIARAETIESPQRVVLDMDSTEIPVYGQQEQSTYNKYYESTCYHPLLLFNGEATVLRRNCGRVTCIVRKTGQNCYYRRSSTSKNSARKWCFAPMLPCQAGDLRCSGGERCEVCDSDSANNSLERDIAELLTRPVGRPSHKPVVWYKAFSIKPPVGRRRGGSGESRVSRWELFREWVLS